MTGMLYIIYLFKGKGDASLCGNYRGSELQDQVLEQLLITCSFASCQEVELQMPSRGTTDVIFILRQLQIKYLYKKKNTYFAFAGI